jgi:PST family polysaccharide transporter
MQTEPVEVQDTIVADIKKKSIKSVFSLTVRRVILRVIGQISFIVLAIVLTPLEFGVFAIVSFIVNFFGFFSDVGLAASLIQKKGELTKQDLQTTFTIQQMLVGTLVLIIILVAPYISNTFYKDALGDNGALLIQILAFSLLLSSLKSIPSIILERKLQFDKLVIPEIVETLLYNIIVVALAWQGFGVWSFIIALLIRGIVGVIIIYAIVPWPIGLSFDKSVFKKLFSFGLPYQLNGLIALVKDNIVPSYIATKLGPVPVGYIGWGQKYAFLPLEVMNDVIRVTFPTYSRLQEHPDLLKKALEKSLYFISLIIYPLSFGMIALIPWIATYILSSPSDPNKWSEAIPLFYLFSVSTFWAAISTTFTNALFAIGKSRVVLNFMILWTVLTWTLTPILTNIYGILGIGIASAIISFTSIGVIIVMKQHVKVNILHSVGPQILAAAVMGFVTRFFAVQYVSGIPTLILAVIVGGLVYAIMLYLLTGKRFLTEIKTITNAYKN